MWSLNQWEKLCEKSSAHFSSYVLRKQVKIWVWYASKRKQMLEKCCSELSLSPSSPAAVWLRVRTGAPDPAKEPAQSRQKYLISARAQLQHGQNHSRWRQKLQSFEICLKAQCLQHPCPSWEQTVLCCGDDDDVCVEHVLRLVLLRRCGRKVNICFWRSCCILVSF